MGPDTPRSGLAAYEFSLKINGIFNLFQSDDKKEMHCRHTKRCYIPQWGTYVQGWVYLWRSGNVVITVKHFKNGTSHDALSQPNSCTIKATLIHGDARDDQVFEKQDFEPHLQSKIGVKLANFSGLSNLMEGGFVKSDAVEIRFSLVPAEKTRARRHHRQCVPENNLAM